MALSSQVILHLWHHKRFKGIQKFPIFCCKRLKLIMLRLKVMNACHSNNSLLSKDIVLGTRTQLERNYRKYSNCSVQEFTG